jgi:hypothetical protein
MARDGNPFEECCDYWYSERYRQGWGAWWLSDNPKSVKLCCKANGDIYNTWQWFMHDMYCVWEFFLYWCEWEELFYCPIDAETSFWIWDECYNHQAFTFFITGSECTDSGAVVSMMTGAEYKEMPLEIIANCESFEPYIWMCDALGITLATQDDTDGEIRFFSSDTTVNTGPGEGYYFGFGIDSSPTPGIQDSIICSTPLSSPTAFDRNIYLKPSTHGLVKFGEYQMTQEPQITGYVKIVTADGKVRKLAVIDDDDEWQEKWGPV